MEWKTKITDLLGCKYPILQGATERLGVWPLAAAVAEAGAHGIITASISKTPEQLREDIRSCKKATAGTFGVNLSIGICPRIDEMLEVCIAEQVPVETALNKPDAMAKRIKESGLKWIHKSARVKDALHAQELGVDAIILVGLEGGGIKNPAQLPTLTTIRHGVRTLSVPVIAAGGIGDGHSFLGALAPLTKLSTISWAVRISLISPTPWPTVMQPYSTSPSIMATRPRSPLIRGISSSKEAFRSSSAKISRAALLL